MLHFERPILHFECVLSFGGKVAGKHIYFTFHPCHMNGTPPFTCLVLLGQQLSFSIKKPEAVAAGAGKVVIPNPVETLQKSTTRTVVKLYKY